MKLDWLCLRVVVAILLVGAVFWLGFQNKPVSSLDALDTVRESGLLKACYISYPPFSSIDPDSGELNGIAVDLTKQISTSAGWELEFVQTTWTELVLSLSSKRCDVVITGIFPLIERANGGVMFSRPIGFVGNNAVVRSDDFRFSSLEELNRSDVTIAVTAGEQGHVFAQKNLPNARLSVVSSGDISLALSEVSTGRADAALGDMTTIVPFARAHPEVRILLDKPYWNRALTFALREDDVKLINFVNNALETMVVSGEIEEIYSRYDADGAMPVRFVS